MICADGNSINQVIMNLVVMPEMYADGGQLTIKTNIKIHQVTPTGCPKPHFCYYVCLSVIDRGLSIEERCNIFLNLSLQPRSE